MSQVQKISNAVLSQLSAEDLLNLDVDSVELVTDGITLPSGLYTFTVKDCEVASVGKTGEEKPAIVTSLIITGYVELDNPADNAIVDTLNLAENPINYKENFLLNSKEGFGLRSFSTFVAGWTAVSGIRKVGDIVPALAGAQGVTRLQVNSYLPTGKADAPENYRENNRLKVTETVWN